MIETLVGAWVSSKGRAALICGVVLTVLTAAESAAATTRVTYVRDRPHRVLAISAGPAQNHLTIAWDASESAYLIHDPLGARGQCDTVDTTTLSCPLEPVGPFRPLLRIRMGGGDDVVAIGGETRGASAYSVVTGGYGDDELVGSMLRDTLSGGPGRDVMRGRGDSDYLRDTVRSVPKSGFDSFLGGSGNDLISAADGERDKRIDGGPGRDQCRWDDRLDPTLTRCEGTD